MEKTNIDIKKWNFPSDHLPIGTTFYVDNKKINIITWNILNNSYISYILDKKNTQLIGNNECMLNSNIPSKIHEGISLRDSKVLDILEDIIKYNDIICLQEVNIELLKFIRLICKENSSNIYTRSDFYDESIIDGQITIFKHKYEFVEGSVDFYTPGKKLTNSILSLELKISENIIFDVINTHVPFKQFDELYSYIKEKESDNLIICGDFNIGLKDIDKISKDIKITNTYLSHINAQDMDIKEKIDKFDYILFRTNNENITFEQISPMFLFCENETNILKNIKL